MAETIKQRSKKGTFLPGTGGPGRIKGVPNKSTTEFRQTVTALLQSNSENVGIWLGQVAKDDPYKALDMLAKLAEYATPKLARQEHVGKDGGDIVNRVEYVIVDSAG